MSFHVAFYFAASAIILTHSKIATVNGQCTTEGCANDDLSMNIVAEIQQQIVQTSGQQNKQIQLIHDVLTASFQHLTTQLNDVTRGLQAVDQRLEEHDTYIKQGQSFHELLNASFQAMKSQHETVNKSFQAFDRRLLEQSQSINDRLNESFAEMKSLQAVDRRSYEHDVCSKQVQSVHELLNESFQEMKGQQGTVMTNLQVVDRRLEEHSFCSKQIQSTHELLNESLQEMKSLQAVDRRSYEHDVCINHVRSIYEFLNESFQPTKNQHDTVRMSLQELDRLSKEHYIYIKQVPIIYEFLNKSFQQMKSQFDAIDANLQTVDRNLENHQIDMKNQTEKSWKLVNDIWDAVPPLRDCSDIKARGYTANGVYKVCAEHLFNRLCANAYCDMKNGTSLVFQRRKDGSVDFNRTWAEYREGFGNPDGEFWLGNEMLHILTSKRKYKLRVDLEDWDGAKGYAEYANFSISSSANNYKLTVGNYSGNAGDSMSYNNGRQFTTIDADNDQYRVNCAENLGGAWWYGTCSYACLNGIYHNRNEAVISQGGINWYHWKSSHHYSFKAAEMKLVPVA